MINCAWGRGGLLGQDGGGRSLRNKLEGVSLGKRQGNSIPSRGNSQCKDHVAGKSLTCRDNGKVTVKATLYAKGHSGRSCVICVFKIRRAICTTLPFLEKRRVSSKVLVAAAATLLSNVIPKGSRYFNANHLNLALKLFF